MTAVAIFVKTPGFSPLKTRLAGTIGPERATRLYMASAAAVAEVARHADIGAVYWATAEAGDQVGDRWPEFPLLEQGSGNLGERMHHILAQLVDRHGRGLLLGADAPQIEPGTLRRAGNWLEGGNSARVTGPARDGGFWTFGANHIPPIDRWTRPAYSRPDTLNAFMDAMGNDAEWLQLPTLTDLDTEQDMAQVAAELRNLPCPLPSQLALIGALEKREPGA